MQCDTPRSIFMISLSLALANFVQVYDLGIIYGLHSSANYNNQGEEVASKQLKSKALVCQFLLSSNIVF